MSNNRLVARTYFPPPPARIPGHGNIDPRLLHAAFDSCTEQESEHGQEEEGNDELVSRRVAFLSSVSFQCLNITRFNARTETSCFDVSLLPSRRVRVGIAQ